MLAVRLDPDLEERLAAAAKLTGKSKSAIAREAIAARIDEFELLVDLEMHVRGRLASGETEVLALRAEYGLRPKS